MRLLANFRLWWQTKQNAWLRQRIAPGMHRLGKRSVFILPTRQGLYLAFFLLAMLLACINYNLSLGYMLTFFVFSVALGAMHCTHQNLLGTQIEVLACEPVFAGSQAHTHITLLLKNTSALHKHAIVAGLDYLSQKKPNQKKPNQKKPNQKNPKQKNVNPHTVIPRTANTSEPADSGTLIQTALAPHSEQRLALQLPPLPRGIHPLPTLHVSSTYPLGLWRAWSYVFAEGVITVYPQPQSPLPNLPALVLEPHQSLLLAQKSASRREEQGDAVSHLENTDNPTVRSIHWPALAKGQVAQRVLELLEPPPSPAQGVWLNLENTSLVGIEAQLSQLCGAVLHCEASNIPFVLQLQGRDYPASKQPAVDAAHVQRCLQALADYPYE